MRSIFSVSFLLVLFSAITFSGCGHLHHEPGYSSESEQEAAVPVSKYQPFLHDTPINNESVTGESYDPVEESGFLPVTRNPFSTFSVDVDTASYSNVRRFLERGEIPPEGAIRIEELINYFNYDDPAPTDGRPIAINSEAITCPWNPQHQLVRIGLKGEEIEAEERSSANLVFLVDVSGSMRDNNKLPLVKRSLLRLLEELSERDHVAIVTYAGQSGIALPATPCNQKRRISQVIDSLRASGSTNGASGLHTAYELARSTFHEGGINRVVLCSDGDFNVGLTNEQQMITFISEQAKSDVFLSVLGFGMGNYHDSRAEKLADHGNGNYAYIDSYDEARKVLVEQLTGTLVTIAKDVKVQVEFNPAHVSAYRLIGYENRALADDEFRDDQKDAGEMGAGHSIMALYEVIPKGAEGDETKLPEFRYQTRTVPNENAHQDELLTLRLRYKLPHAEQGIEMTQTLLAGSATFEQASDNIKFASAVALFGMILGDSQFTEEVSWQTVLQLAESSLGDDPSGYRREFLQLIQLAKQLVHQPEPKAEPLVTTPRDYNILPFLAVVGLSQVLAALRG